MKHEVGAKFTHPDYPGETFVVKRYPGVVGVWVGGDDKNGYHHHFGGGYDKIVWLDKKQEQPPAATPRFSGDSGWRA